MLSERNVFANGDECVCIYTCMYVKELFRLEITEVVFEPYIPQASPWQSGNVFRLANGYMNVGSNPTMGAIFGDEN